MFVVAVTVWVKPDKVEDFQRATLENGRATRRESDNLRFDVNQCVDEPGRFLLYEVYRDEEAFKDHQRTPHYLKWREAVADWMAQPRQGVKHQSLFPLEEREW
jgi:autoinducer 2-degrading protein